MLSHKKSTRTERPLLLPHSGYPSWPKKLYYLNTVDTTKINLKKFLELVQYKNDLMESLDMFVLKLPRFFTRKYDQEKSTAISNLTHFMTPSSCSYIVSALVSLFFMSLLLLFLPFSPIFLLCFVIHWRFLSIPDNSCQFFLKQQKLSHSCSKNRSHNSLVVEKKPNYQINKQQN